MALTRRERGDAVVASPTPGAKEDVVLGASAGTKVKQLLGAGKASRPTGPSFFIL